MTTNIRFTYTGKTEQDFQAGQERYQHDINRRNTDVVELSPQAQATTQKISSFVIVLKGAAEGIKDAFKGSALVFSGLGAGIGVGVATLAGAVSFFTGGIAAIVLLSVFGGYVVYKAIEGGYDAYDKANHSNYSFQEKIPSGTSYNPAPWVEELEKQQARLEKFEND